MSPRFVIETDWEGLEDGSREERAAFGAIGIRIDERWLTEAHDSFVNRVRQKVNLSGYLLAQWLAWNWWRLRWEPRRYSSDWDMAHRLTTVGGGYVWPNIAFDTDNDRVLLRAVPAQPRASEPLRYVAYVSEALPAAEFQAGIDRYIEMVLEKLRLDGVLGSNLENIWACVQEERSDPESAVFRRLEAAMGHDPDDLDESVVQALMDERDMLGESGVSELAADTSEGATVPNSQMLHDLMNDEGHEVDLSCIPGLPVDSVPKAGAKLTAWQVGERAAQALRRQEGLGDGLLSIRKLADLAGTKPEVLTSCAGSRAPLSFALNGNGSQAKIVLPSQVVASRRFALARMIGDRILTEHKEPLIPLLRSSTYRQKLQRAFAAELLCPVECTRQHLKGDLSEENQERLAAKYQVSPRLIETQLMNKGLLGRPSLDIF